MPGRPTPLVTGEIYHIFNRGIARQPTYNDARDYRRFLDSMHFYLTRGATPSFSKFTHLSNVERTNRLIQMAKLHNYYIDLIGYCLMPNHFHLVVRQQAEEGISTYMSNLVNSYTRHFNLRHDRGNGALFQGRFKAVRIETDEQLIHVIRYIHLNPYTSYVVKTLTNLEKYPYSSFGIYLENRADLFIDQTLIKEQFTSCEKLRQFTFDQADYQRELANIKHLVLEEI